ncbi:hypothetical protein, partial [Niveispirillum sp. KHB5.9]|uniref:hypothetical protein n=1 Tax=Niveispirillum sp. KHB5.9 TaxID=3400269 RepID=UPI003A86E8CA
LRQVEDLTDAYSCLKLEMDKQKRHEDELMFFSKELECRRVEWGAIKGIPILLYGWTCDYGQSFMLPLCWLLNLIIIGFDIMMDLQTNLPWEKALLVSVANCLGNFSFRKEIGELSIATHMFSMFQGTIALILLFLIGLGLRNRFRMK